MCASRAWKSRICPCQSFPSCFAVLPWGTKRMRGRSIAVKSARWYIFVLIPIVCASLLRHRIKAYAVLCLKPAIQYAVFNRLKAVTLAYRSGKSGWGAPKELTAVQVGALVDERVVVVYSSLSCCLLVRRPRCVHQSMFLLLHVAVVTFSGCRTRRASTEPPK